MPKEEEIRASIDNMDPDVLKDTLAILLAKGNTTSAPVRTEQHKEYKNFAQAILDLRSRFKFPELDFFTTEADLVYVQAGDRRVLLTDKTVKIEPERRTPAPEETNESEVATDTEVDSMDNAFENVKPNDSRFSRLEL